MLNSLGKRISRNIFFAMILVLGVALSLIVSSTSYYSNKRLIEAEFNGVTNNLYSAFKRELDSDLAVLQSLQALFYTMPEEVGRAEFNSFTNHILQQHTSIKALEWIPSVTDSRRQDYEQAAREAGFTNFQFTQLISQGRMKRAEKRSEYFPVYFVEPYRGNELALGFDLASSETRLSALDSARKTGMTRATARITLVQETKDQLGFIVFAPIYRESLTAASEQARSDNIRGFALGVFRIGDIAEHSVKYLRPEGINFSIRDESAPEEEQFLYAHSSGTSQEAMKNQKFVASGLTKSMTIDVCGRKWLITYWATRDFVSTRSSLRYIHFFLAGLAFTGLVAGFLLSVIHAENVETAYNYTRSLIEAIPDPCVIIDSEGKVTDVNAAAEQITGIGRSELIGTDFAGYFTEPEQAGHLYQLAYSGQHVTNQSLSVRHASGKETYLLCNASIFRNEQGQVAGIIASGRDISDRRQAEEQLIKSLKEKEVLLKEIHHRVKNNMQVIYSLLSLQAEDVTDELVRAKFQESRDKVYSISLIHESLYRSTDLAHIDFKEYLETLVNRISESYRLSRVKCIVDMDHLELDINVGIPCGLIINELVSNSLKYAFPDGRDGIIRVGINIREDGNYVLYSEDNGVGLSNEINFFNAPSLGLQLVNALAKQIHGTIEMTHSQGTKVKITFPRNEYEKEIHYGQENYSAG